MNLSPPEYILSIKPYEPGKPIEAVEREYGITDSIKLASNENPLGPSPMALRAIENAMGMLHRYPDGGAFELTRDLARHLNLLPENIVFGNGSDEIIGMLARAFLRPGDEAVMPEPSFLMYDIMTRCSGAVPQYVPLKEFAIDLDQMLTAVTPATRLVFITNPNNPTGTMITKRQMDGFIEALPSSVVLVVDEAYIEFVQDEHCAMGTDYLDRETPVVVLRTFSKIYGLAGLRVGYGLMPKEISSLLNRVRQPFNLSSLAQAAAREALKDQEFLNKTLTLVQEGIQYLFRELDRRKITFFPTHSNFFMIDVKQDAAVVFEKMLRLGVIVRSMRSYGFPNYIRVTVGLPEENQRFIQALEKVML